MNYKTVGAVFYFALLLASSYGQDSPLISVQKAKTIIDTDSSVVIFDVSKGEAYANGHIENAIPLSRKELRNKKAPFKGLISTLEKTQIILKGKGVADNSRILLYDNDGNVESARVWWVLNYYNIKEYSVGGSRI